MPSPPPEHIERTTDDYILDFCRTSAGCPSIVFLGVSLPAKKIDYFLAGDMKLKYNIAKNEDFEVQYRQTEDAKRLGC